MEIELLLKAATAAIGTGNEANALSQVEAALKQQPLEARLWQVKGLLHRSLEDLKPAAEAFAAASRLEPRSARIAHGHARVTMEAGVPSLSLFERASRMAPNDGDLILSRSAALLAEGRALDAIAGMDLVVRRNPAWTQGQAALVKLRWMMGERETATSTLRESIAASPRNAALWLELINLLVLAEAWNEALLAVNGARAAAGTHMAFDISEAICASETGNAFRADQLFRALRSLPQAEVAVRHVRHLLRTGRPGEAVERGEAILGTSDAGQMWPYMGLAWRLLDDPKWQWLDDPRLVGIYDLADEIGSLGALADRLRAIHMAVGQPLDQSVRGGTQTDGPLFARIDPEIRRLRAAIVAAVERHVVSLPAVDPGHPVLRLSPASVRFSGSWSVRLSGSGHHSNHIHPAGWLSSALYVALPASNESGAPPAGWLTLGQPPSELGLDLAPTRLIEPRPGRLVLFPSIMWHGTMPFERGERLTVAFDVAPPKAPPR